MLNIPFERSHVEQQEQLPQNILVKQHRSEFRTILLILQLYRILHSINKVFSKNTGIKLSSISPKICQNSDTKTKTTGNVIFNDGEKQTALTSQDS